MKIYHYAPDTGEYMCAGTASISPREQKKYLIPAFATEQAPPASKPNEIAVWDGTKWQVKPDFRGTEYWLPDGTKHKIEKIGENKPANALNVEPKEFVTKRLWEELRAKRNGLLVQSDWRLLPDSGADHTKWKIYRQALRDLPANTTDPATPNWPTPPK